MNILYKKVVANIFRLTASQIFYNFELLLGITKRTLIQNYIFYKTMYS